jgi:hypothetical protein
MPSFILKASPDADIYLEWSTIVDDATWVGGRAEAQTRYPADRIVRADDTGTSEKSACFGAWDDESLIVQQQGLLPRDRLLDYARTLQAHDEEAGLALLEPFGDDEDEGQ